MSEMVASDDELVETQWSSFMTVVLTALALGIIICVSLLMKAMLETIKRTMRIRIGTDIGRKKQWREWKQWMSQLIAHVSIEVKSHY